MIKETEAPAPTKTRNLEKRKFNEFVVDLRVQRPLDQNRVDLMAASFERDVVGVLVAWENEGALICLDGQTRAAAAKLAGFGDSTVDTEVWRGLDIPGAARLFRLYNNTKKPDRLDLFNIAVTEGEPTAVACAAILQRHGFIPERAHRNSFVAPAALEYLYGLDGGKTADLTFQVLVDTWGVRREAVQATLIKGMGAFLFRYAESVKVASFVERLKKEGDNPNAIIGRARTYGRTVHVDIVQAMATILTNTYNTNRRGNALPAWA